jgi:hypothetical protein
MIGLFFRVLFTVIMALMIAGIVMFVLAFVSVGLHFGELSFDNLQFGMLEDTSMHIADPFSMVVAIVAIVSVVGLLRELVKRRHDSSVSNKELVEIKQRLTGIEAELADIKEQIADFIIKTN